MGYQFQPKDANTMGQSLKVQELSIRGSDFSMFAFGGGVQPAGSPYLGSAASFALLASTAITNSASAPSVITGNFGIYPNTSSSVTGFPPGVIVGQTHYADAVAQQAKIDALAAYTDLASRSATAIPAILDGQTLTPGVYSEASSTFNLAASGNGTLTLNGAGLYVFKAASTLTTGAGGIPTITLTNGAKASDIYWVVGSSATINSGVTSAGATFPGNIIAVTSITVTQGGSVLNGRLIALNAAITLSNATLTTGTLLNGPDSSCIVLIREPVGQVDFASLKVDLLNSVTQFQLASFSIVDSFSFLVDPNGNKGGIKILGLPSLAINDLLVVKYRVLEQPKVT